MAFICNWDVHNIHKNMALIASRNLWVDLLEFATVIGMHLYIVQLNSGQECRREKVDWKEYHTNFQKVDWNCAQKCFVFFSILLTRD